MAVLLQDVHYVVFVFGKHLSETVGFFDSGHGLRRLAILRIAQHCGIKDVRTHPQLAGRFLGDGQLVAGHHLHAHAHLLRARDRCFGLLARRIEHWQHANKLPPIFLVRPGHAQGTEAARGKFFDGFLHRGLYFACVGRHFQNHLRRAFGHKKLFSVRALDGGFGALMHRIERLEMEYLKGL